MRTLQIVNKLNELLYYARVTKQYIGIDKLFIEYKMYCYREDLAEGQFNNFKKFMEVQNEH